MLLCPSVFVPEQDQTRQLLFVFLVDFGLLRMRPASEADFFPVVMKSPELTMITKLQITETNYTA